MATRYIDFTQSTGTLTGTWTFTNGSGSVTGSGGDAQTELADGDYIRMSDGVEWYKVDGEPPGVNEITIDPVFQQATHADDAGASLYNSEDGTTDPGSYPDAGHEAFCHPNQYTTDEVRAAGDIGKMRANQTHKLGGLDVSFDEDGTYNSKITLKGCTSVDDPWSDGSDVRPVLDFDGTVNNCDLSNDINWKFENLDFTGCSNNQGNFYCNASHGAIFNNCRFYDCTGAAGRGLNLTNSNGIIIQNCVFYDNTYYNLYFSGVGVAFVEGCTFNGGAGATQSNYGLEATSTSVYIRDSTFGITTDHDSSDIRITEGMQVLGRNVKLDSATEVSYVAAERLIGSFIRLEDDEQTHLAFRAWFWSGNLTRTTAVNRSGEGGTSWSMLGEGNSNCGSEQALYLIGGWLRGLPIYLDGTAQTITVWAYATSWTGLPTVSQFVVEIEHYEGAADWEIDATADTFAANDQWESFAITLTPGAAGPAYLRVYLKDYEDGTEKIYIDPVPLFS